MAQKTKSLSKETMDTNDRIAAVRSAATNARAAADKTVKKSRSAIQKRPLTAVGAGIAAGAAVGLIAGALIVRNRTGKDNAEKEVDAEEIEELDEK